MSAARDLSVIVPVRDGESTIQAALGSILEHADGLLEIVVVDDHSRDRSAELAAAASPLVRVVAGRGLGPAAARNDGIAAARGSVIGFLDADDLWAAPTPDPRRAALAAAPGAVATGLTQVRRDGEQLGDPAVLWLFGATLLPCALALAHPLDETLLRGEDLEWFLRIRDAGVAVEVVDEVVLTYHRAAGSLSEDSSAGLLAGLHSAIKRRAEARA